MSGIEGIFGLFSLMNSLSHDVVSNLVMPSDTESGSLANEALVGEPCPP
jgi:hypothetical protein